MRASAATLMTASGRASNMTRSTPIVRETRYSSRLSYSSRAYVTAPVGSGSAAMSDMPSSIASHLLPVRKPRRLTRDDARRPAAASVSACYSLRLLTVTLRLMECTHRHVQAISLQDSFFLCFQFFSDLVQRACSFSGVDDLRSFERGSPSSYYRSDSPKTRMKNTAISISRLHPHE